MWSRERSTSWETWKCIYRRAHEYLLHTHIFEFIPFKVSFIFLFEGNTFECPTFSPHLHLSVFKARETSSHANWSMHAPTISSTVDYTHDGLTSFPFRSLLCLAFVGVTEGYLNTTLSNSNPFNWNNSVFPQGDYHFENVCRGVFRRCCHFVGHQTKSN